MLELLPPPSGDEYVWRNVEVWLGHENKRDKWMEKDKSSTTYLNAIKTFLPVKIYGMMKAGRPLRCNSSSWSRIFQRGRTGISVEKKKKRAEQPVEREWQTEVKHVNGWVFFLLLLRSVDGAALLACDYVALTWVTNTVRSAGLHSAVVMTPRSVLGFCPTIEEKKRNKRIECVCFWLLWQSGCVHPETPC